MELRRGVTRARELRLGSTDAEALLWTRLRGGHLAGFKFRRQFPISGYVVDLVCLSQRLVIEVDGGQHEDQVDAQRSMVLAKSGFRVSRFWNDEVLLRIDDVLVEILKLLEAPP